MFLFYLSPLDQPKAMTTDFRALCAELTDDLELWVAYGDTQPTQESHDLIDRARAALAEPEPPADGEVAEVVEWLREGAQQIAWVDSCPVAAGGLTRAADLLERLAEPVPVGPSDAELLRCMIDAANSVPGGQSTGIIDWESEALAAARAVLARWGNQ